jgi:formylglycine-generating enzyme required for sulfatase activity
MSPRPLKVFLCHAHADRDAVRALYTRLTNDGVDAWLDKANLLPGQDWELEIKKAVREADVVVVCLSKQFNQAGFRQKEVRLALDTAMEKPEGEIFIIPARLEECDNLESLRKWHWVDLFEENGYEMLMRALRTRADNVGATLQIKQKRLPDVSPFLQPTQKSNLIDPNTPREEHRDPEVEINRPRQKITVKKLFGNTVLVFWSVFVLSAIVLSFWLPSIPKLGFLDETQESFPMPSATEANQNSSVTSTQEPAIAVMATSLPTEITDAKGVSMVLVPEGEFIMGSENGDADESPAHEVYLNSFYIDIYEVTNAAYKSCLMEGVCTLPEKTSSFTRPDYFENSQYDNYPVININWNQANTYCEWRGGSLPTEAQWEKSARGVDGRIFPWGNNFDHTRVNFCDKNCSLDWANKDSDDGFEDTAPVGSYESGKSPYGIYDLAGNVSEWVNDWYDETYYQISPYANPVGPEVGQMTFSGPIKVKRGGSWTSVDDTLTVFFRDWYYPDFFDVYDNFGFRCAKDVIP